MAERRKEGEEGWSLRRPSAIIPLAAAFLLAALAIWVAVQYVEIPDVTELGRNELAEATTVFTADGEILTRYYEQNRIWVPLDSIADPVIEALIATEDERFYQHWGIDVRRLIGATFKTATGNPQGGSTITMQLVRNAFEDVGNDWVLERKVKEWLAALKIEGEYEKDEILEIYLNTVPWLYNAYGIEAAARTYFSKSADELEVPEAATLVGMLKGTTLYNPVRNPERSHERRNTVLQRMVEAGYLSPARYDELKNQPTTLEFAPITHEHNLAPYFAEYVRQWLGEWAKARGYDIYRDGLRVYSTIDAEMQRAATEAVQDVADNLQAVVDVSWSEASPPFFSTNAADYKAYQSEVEPFAYFWRAHPEVLERLIKADAAFRELVDEGVSETDALERLRNDAAYVDSLKQAIARLEAGFLAMNPENGHIKAWVGGRDYAVDKYDHVATAKRQPGSTFKPFVYATALANGYTENTMLPDRTFEYRNAKTGQVWAPGNFGDESGQMMPLHEALAHSKNTITAQLIMDVGPGAVADYARRMGIRSDLEAYPSLALGTSPVTLLEMVAAYATLASNGIYHEPLAVTRIEDKDGTVLATFDAEARQAIPPAIAYGTLNMMRGVIDEGTGIRMRTQYAARGDLAGKTGTTQDAADTWFMLVHPELVMGAWVGFDSPLLTFRTQYWGQGSHTALHAVGQFFNAVDLPTSATFSPPASYVPPSENPMPPGRLASDDSDREDAEDDDTFVEGIIDDWFSPDNDTFGRRRPGERPQAEERSRRSPGEADQRRPSRGFEVPQRERERSTPPDQDVSGDPEPDVRERQRDEAGSAPEGPPDVEQLNRQERRRSNVGEILDRIRENEGNGQDGN